MPFNNKHTVILHLNISLTSINIVCSASVTTVYIPNDCCKYHSYEQ